MPFDPSVAGRPSLPRRMAVASVSNQNGLLLHGMTPLSVSFTRVNRVFEIQASADGEALNNQVAHVDVVE